MDSQGYGKALSETLKAIFIGVAVVGVVVGGVIGGAAVYFSTRDNDDDASKVEAPAVEQPQTALQTGPTAVVVPPQP